MPGSVQWGLYRVFFLSHENISLLSPAHCTQCERRKPRLLFPSRRQRAVDVSLMPHAAHWQGKAAWHWREAELWPPSCETCLRIIRLPFISALSCISSFSTVFVWACECVCECVSVWECVCVCVSSPSLKSNHKMLLQAWLNEIIAAKAKCLRYYEENYSTL